VRCRPPAPRPRGPPPPSSPPELDPGASSELSMYVCRGGSGLRLRARWDTRTARPVKERNACGGRPAALCFASLSTCSLSFLTTPAHAPHVRALLFFLAAADTHALTPLSYERCTKKKEGRALQMLSLTPQTKRSQTSSLHPAAGGGGRLGGTGTRHAGQQGHAIFTAAPWAPAPRPTRPAPGPG